MPKFIFFFAVALLLLPSCSPCKKACANRYCPPTAPTRPICPETTPACKQTSPKCGCKKKKAARKTCRQTKTITLNNLTDYMPGLPPGYWGI